MNNWTGTGYIATNGNKGVSFVITNGTNGGFSTGEITADLSCVVLGSAALLADSVMLIDLGVGLLLTGNVILAAVVIAFAATMMYQAIESYSDAVSLYLDAASRSETAEQSAEQLKTHAKIGALTFAGSLIAGPVLQKAGSVAVTAGEKIAQTRFGNVVGYVFEKTGKPVADKIYNWGSGVNSAVRRTNLYQRMIEGSIREEIAAELVIREYTDDVLEKIWRSNKSEELATVLKDAPDEYVEFINKSVHPEYSLELVSEFGEEGCKVSLKCTDEILETISQLESKTEIVSFISKYEFDGVRLFRYGGNELVSVTLNQEESIAKLFVETLSEQDDTSIHFFVRALNNIVNPDEVVGFVNTYGLDGINAFNKYGEEVILAVKEGKTISEFVQLNGSYTADQLYSFALKNNVTRVTNMEMTEIDKILNFCNGRQDLSEKLIIAINESIGDENLTLLERVYKYELPDVPKEGELSAYKTRIWYKWQESLIPNRIDYSQGLESAARQACDLRNTIRSNARYYMNDSSWSYYLFENEENRPFEFFVEKYSAFYEGDDLWNIIIEKATTSRDAVNVLFGLE
ncbi:MAG: hypothetical protein ACI4KB_03370 [Oscillospiraceae bacterium]